MDVVIGYVEPHERPETIAQIGDMEIIPPRLSAYHGITLKEMDVAADHRAQADRRPRG